MNLKKLIPIIVSAAIFIVILINIDIPQLINYFKNINFFFLITSFLLIIPVVVINAFRYVKIISKEHNLPLNTSIKLTLAGASLNTIMPSKFGDLIRAYYLKKKKKIGLNRGIASILFEKYMDLFALFFLSFLSIIFIKNLNNTSFAVVILCFFFILLSFFLFFIDLNKLKDIVKLNKIRELTNELIDFTERIKHDFLLFLYIISLSLLNWFLQLIQFYFFFSAFNFKINPMLMFLVPIAIIIGMVPISFNGVGIRDSALIFLFMNYAPVSLVAGVGILATLRNVIPAVAGLAFIRKYLKL